MVKHVHDFRVRYAMVEGCISVAGMICVGCGMIIDQATVADVVNTALEERPVKPPKAPNMGPVETK